MKLRFVKSYFVLIFTLLCGFFYEQNTNANPPVDNAAQKSGNTNTGMSMSDMQTTLGFANSLSQAAGESSLGTGIAVASSGLSAAMLYFMAQTEAETKPGSPMVYVYYGMAGLSALQGVMALQDQGASNNVKNIATNPTTGGGSGGGGSDTHDDLPIPPNAVDLSGSPIGRKSIKASEIINAAAKQGVKVNPKTGEVTLPNGTKVSGSSFSSPAGLAAMGATSSGIKSIEDVLNLSAAQVSAGYKVSNMGVDSSGGGGGARPANNNRGVSSYSGFKWPGFEDGKPKPANVAGLTKMANGEPIGVAQDDIFKMMQRAYGSRQGHGMFIEE